MCQHFCQMKTTWSVLNAQGRTVVPIKIQTNPCLLGRPGRHEMETRTYISNLCEHMKKCLSARGRSGPFLSRIHRLIHIPECWDVSTSVTTFLMEVALRSWNRTDFFLLHSANQQKAFHVWSSEQAIVSFTISSLTCVHPSTHSKNCQVPTAKSKGFLTFLLLLTFLPHWTILTMPSENSLLLTF